MARVSSLHVHGCKSQSMERAWWLEQCRRHSGQGLKMASPPTLGTPLRTRSVPLSPAGSIRVRITHLSPSLGGSPSPPKGSTQPTLLQAEGGADLGARADQASSHVALWTWASLRGKAFQLTFSKSSFRQISRCNFSCKFLFSTFKRSISSLSSTGRSIS